MPINLLGATNSAQRTALRDALNAVAPDGSTPTFDAYAYAVTHLLQESSAFQGKKYAVLMTDGVPTFGEKCTGGELEQAPAVPTDPIVQLVQQAADVDVSTFVTRSSPAARLRKCSTTSCNSRRGVGDR